MSGGDGNDSMYGNAGNDQMYGGAGNDLISGGTYTIFSRKGNDLIEGGDGNDTLLGETGNDTIDGGAGSDSLSGGAGVDTFVFAAGSGRDILQDYQRGEAIHIASALWSGTVEEFVAQNVGFARGILTIRFSDVDRVQITGSTPLVAADFLDAISFV